MRGVGKCTTQDRPAGTLSLATIRNGSRWSFQQSPHAAQSSSKPKHAYVRLWRRRQRSLYVLREQSQNHNVKLLLVTEQVVKDIVELARAKYTRRVAQRTG